MSTTGRSAWPTGSVIRIESSCAIGSSNCSCQEETVHRSGGQGFVEQQRKLEGVNPRARAEETQKEKGYMGK
jgi:hypothetical protein